MIDSQGLVLSVIAHIGVERSCLCMSFAGRLGEILSLNSLSRGVSLPLPCLGSAFVGFGLNTLCFMLAG